MITTPSLVQDAPIVRMTNSVLVGTMKFTLDQFDATFSSQNPAPARIAAQLVEFRNKYNNLNSAYALSRESLLTIDIQSLDLEGDQLFIGSRETVEGARRMIAVPARKLAGDRLWVFYKKYSIDVKENMISEWSKLQQMTEEANNSTQLTADLATLGLTELWARLTEITGLLRDKLTERSGELPAQKAMKQAREAIYPEYRLLVQLLNAYALVDSDVHKFDTLISTLNNNIDYVRIHAMSGGGSIGNQNNPNNPNTPENPENPENPETPTNPTNPNNPTNPDNPTNPNTPDNPDNPVNPGGGGDNGGDEPFDDGD